MQRRVAEFGNVVRRHRRRHAHRDALRAVGEEVRKIRRQDLRLFGRAIIGRLELDRVLGDALQQSRCDIGHAGFGIAIGGGAIAIDIAEIALPVDQRVAHGEILRQAHQRVVDRLVAVRMETADDVSDDLRRFLVGLVGVEPEQAHGVQNAPMDRLQAVACIGERPLRDGRQRIGEIALLERLAQVHDLTVIPGGHEVGTSHWTPSESSPHYRRAGRFQGTCPLSGPTHAREASPGGRVGGGSIWRGSQTWRSRK